MSGYSARKADTVLRLGSLFSGYGGLTLAVQNILGGETAWHAEVDPAACRVLEHHWPDVPNIGDVTAVDWSTVPAVDLLDGGYPCQSQSEAGLRLGTDDDRWLWPHYLDAITAMRPRLAVGENVEGHVRRELRVVVADLQRAGYAVAWVTVAASDIGACHERRRVFWLAWPETDAPPATLGHPIGWLGESGWLVDDLLGQSPVGRWPYAGTAYAGTAYAGTAPVLLPTPRTTDTNGVGVHGQGGMDLRTAISLLPQRTLPTPRASDAAKGGPNQRGSSGDLMLPSAVAQLPQRALPTPTARDVKGANQRGDATCLPGALDLWGQYAQAIARHEEAFGRPAPDPTGPHGKGGAQRLSGRFTEWMMTVPDGWVTNVPGISNNDAIRLCGNGVVVEQGKAALRVLLERAGIQVGVAA